MRKKDQHPRPGKIVHAPRTAGIILCASHPAGTILCALRTAENNSRSPPNLRTNREKTRRADNIPHHLRPGKNGTETCFPRRPENRRTAAPQTPTIPLPNSWHLPYIALRTVYTALDSFIPTLQFSTSAALAILHSARQKCTKTTSRPPFTRIFARYFWPLWFSFYKRTLDTPPNFRSTLN